MITQQLVKKLEIFDEPVGINYTVRSMCKFDIEFYKKIYAGYTIWVILFQIFVTKVNFFETFFLIFNFLIGKIYFQFFNWKTFILFLNKNRL